MKKIFSELKILWKPFLVVFLICFLIINWNSVSWVFNYKVISQFFFGFFQKTFSQSLFPEVSETQQKKLKESSASEKENSLEIPKIGVFSPLILVEKESQVKLALDIGVVLFPESSLPGKVGQTIILGHSAPSNWPKIKYDWVFSQLSQLEENDEIFLHFNHRRFSYFVKKKIFLEKGEELPQTLTNSENVLILISCWPPGKDIRRIAVRAE